mgnify:CR=1 FL=1
MIMMNNDERPCSNLRSVPSYIQNFTTMPTNILFSKFFISSPSMWNVFILKQINIIFFNCWVFLKKSIIIIKAKTFSFSQIKLLVFFTKSYIIIFNYIVSAIKTYTPKISLKPGKTKRYLKIIRFTIKNKANNFSLFCLFLKRINKLFIEIQSGVPILSDSEKRMKEDLENIQVYMKFMKSSIQELQNCLICKERPLIITTHNTNTCFPSAKIWNSIPENIRYLPKHKLYSKRQSTQLYLKFSSETAVDHDLVSLLSQRLKIQ